MPPYGRAARAGPLAGALAWPPDAAEWRTTDLPPLALPACFSTWKRSSGPGPCPGSSGRWDARGNRRRGGRSRPRSRKLRRVLSCEARGHACIGACLASHAARWRSRSVPRHPHVQTGFRRGPVPRPILPSAFALRCRSGRRRPGGAVLLAASPPANLNGRAGGRRSGAFEARRLHGGRLRRMLREARRDCARAARATTRRQQPERHARWHDERHGSVGGRSACLQPDRMRDADHGGCADRPEIAAVERCRIGHAQQEQLALSQRAAMLPGWQRPAHRSAGSAAAVGTPSMRT